MTPIQGISLVLVTGEISVGLSTLITEVTESHYIVLALIWFIRALTAKKRSPLCTALHVLSPPPLHYHPILSCHQPGEYEGLSQSPYRSPLRLASGSLAYSQNRCPQFCVMAERVKRVFVCRDLSDKSRH